MSCELDQDGIDGAHSAEFTIHCVDLCEANVTVFNRMTFCLYLSHYSMNVRNARNGRHNAHGRNRKTDCSLPVLVCCRCPRHCQPVL